MRRRSYEQYCTLARALDIVGERWTLLIVRELMLGPRRFKDLLHGLPGVGRNLLAARLRHLAAEGLIVRRELPPPAGSRVYELTDDGRSLGPAMAELARWGVKRLGRPHRGQTFRPAWAMFPLSYMADTAAARGVRETYEFQIENETFHLRVADGTVEPRAGSADQPDLILTMDKKTIRDLLSGELGPLEAVSTRRVTFEGSPQAFQRAVTILGGQPD
jgi:DNA-binding HxlR family transcriptional regulator